ncbi:MAG: M20/M25/M40 family metallo-hydrolase [Acidobacteriota bacterium]|nr:M20/M25/M40 family metallo-hydrolase [Acidobacteriota bacterium]
MSCDVVKLARSLIDIDSTTGQEAAVGRWLAGWLREQNFEVEEQRVESDRLNLYVTLGDPTVVFSTHLDCVPPFFPSREENGRLYGRGACDAKGIAAAQIAALERLRATGQTGVGLLLVVGEERGSHGAHAANRTPRGSRYLVNGEPTDSRLGIATRGVYRVRLRATGRAAHSSHPEQGISAIDTLVDALIALRELPLPTDGTLGTTTFTVALIDGGVAPNVVPPHATAEVNFRTVGPALDLRAALDSLSTLVDLEDVAEVPPVEMVTVPGFDTAVFPFTTDIPFLDAWGKPILFGPGSVLVAHTDEEHVEIAELQAAVGHYVEIAKALLEAA